MSDVNVSRKTAVAAWTRLVRIYQRIDRVSERSFQHSGLNAAWFDVLARVRAREGMTQGELAESLLVTKGNISQLMAKLVTAGLLVRQAEGRKQRLYLTARGREIADDAVPRQEALLEASLAPLTAEEQALLVRLLRKWEKS